MCGTSFTKISSQHNGFAITIQSNCPLTDRVRPHVFSVQSITLIPPAIKGANHAREILKEEKTINQIASEFGVHPNVLYRWKKQALENLPKLFEDETKSERETPGRTRASGQRIVQ